MKPRTVKIKGICIYRAIPKLRKDTIPPDMLRYDGAFVCDKYPGLVAYTGDNARRHIAPTYARWESFWFKLVRIGLVKYIDPSEWYSYISVHGGMNLSKIMMCDMEYFGQPVRYEFNVKGFDYETPADIWQT